MSLEPGQKLSQFCLVEKIGEGGMGVVWSAQDTKLGRDVAIKVLPELFSGDADRMVRFEREAKMLASLNHPNIAAIYGLEEAEDVRFLVLELVPGEDLAQRLSRGPLAQAEALDICGQIAEALDAAHCQGILHRDLKPANVKITPGGKVKVLDFGLAKAVDPSSKSGELSLSPTITRHATEAGMIMGTAAYMSPEQARGKPVDRRTDIWAFGCVLFEALTGRRAFSGETVSDIIACILQREPAWDQLPASLPGPIRRLLTRCLQRDPDRRLRDIGDAALEIRESREHERAVSVSARVPAATAAPPRRGALLAWVVGALLLGAALGWLIQGSRKAEGPATTTSRRPMRFEMALPEDAPVAAGSFLNPLALSPDGRRLVYVGAHNGVRRLYLREMSEFQSEELPGTDGAEGPFFSPDGEWVAFYASGALRKTSVHGGLPVRIVDMIDFRGGTWGGDDTIVFSPGQVNALRAVSSDGSGERQLTVMDESRGEWTHRMPQFLPDGDTVLYAVQIGEAFTYDSSNIQAISVATGEHRDVLDASTYVRYSSAGYLLYVQAGRLLALPFDADELKAVGTAIPLMDGVAVQTNTGAAQFAVADDGTLAFLPGEPIGDEVHLVWVDRDGVTSEFTRDRIVYRHPRFSPDGKQLSIQMIGGGRSGTWISPIDRPGFRSFDPESASFLWGPDGKWAIYRDLQDQRHKILRQPVDRSEEPRTLFEGKEIMAPATVTPSGDTLAFTRQDPTSGDDIWLVDTDGKQDARPFLQTGAQEGGARFSPDGRYLAYVSNATGHFEVMVTSYPEPGSGWQVSIDGGREPIWSPDGHEIYFRSGDKIMAASVQLSPGFRNETPRVLFVGGYEGLLGGLDAGNYDISPDGKRFVMVQSPELQVTLDRIHVVLGWAATLQ